MSHRRLDMFVPKSFWTMYSETPRMTSCLALGAESAVPIAYAAAGENSA
jgi:hypothetical protein